MEKVLRLYKYIDGVNDTPFPNSDEHIVVREFRYDAKRMGGAPTISFTAMHRLCLDDLWSKDVYATFNGERYYIKQTPTSSYSNSDTRYKHEVELISERSVLDNIYFYDVVTSTSVDKPVSNSSKFTFFGDVHEYANRLGYSLKWANVDYTIVVDEGITSEEKQVTFEDQVVTNALQEIYNIYQIPYYFVGKVIHVGEYQNNIDHVFKYGVNNSLLSISKNNANAKIVNRITGVGSQDNIPYYYPNDDEKGVTIPLLNGSSSGVSISNQSRYRKVRLSDKFVFHRSIQTQTPLIDSSIYTLGDLTFDKKEEGKDAQYSVDFYYTFSLDDGENVLCNVSTDDENTVDLRYEIYKRSGNHLGNFSGDKTISLTGGTYNLIVRWTFLNQNVMFGVEEQLESLISSKLKIAAYIIVDEKQTWTLKNIPVNLYNYGLSVNNPVDGDVITIKQESYINPQPFLMPYVYRKQGGNERFYNAENNTYRDENGEYYVFENEYSKNHPSEHIENFDDIKPTIKNVTNAGGDRIDRFVDFAYDTYDNDEVDEEGKFIHKYFFAKLNKFDGENGFNLFNHAIDESEMVISMTSGSCGSCSFKVMVNKDTQKNTVQVDEYGNLLRDSNGNVRFGSPQDSQNDTENNEVWIALEKDIDTFGVLMPNATNKYRPSAGDTFVILHIDLPKAYIEAAEKRLDDKLIKYMHDNNFEKFNFSIAFSRIFFAENPSILNGLNENSKITIEYNGREHSLYASSISITMTNEQPLPEIKVELNDNIAVSQNQISQIVDATKKDILSKTTKDVFWGDIKGIPSWIGSEKPRYSYSELSGAAPISNSSDSVWVIKKDDNGQEYAFSAFDIVTQKGVTMYADGGQLDLPSIYKGLPIDNKTIYWEDILDDEGNKIDQRLKARVVGEGGEVVATMLGDLKNVGAWANVVAEEDRIMVQKKDSATWVEMKLSELGGADFSKVSYYGAGNAFTSLELSEDGKSLYFYKGETFATHEDLLSKWTRDDVKIDNWDTAYGWGNHANAGYLKDADISSKYLKLSGGVMGKDSSITSAYIYPLEDNKYALGLPNRAYGYVYSHRYFVDDLEIKKSQDDVLYIDANLVVRGGITMYGTDGTTASSIWDGAPKATTSNTPNGKGIASFDSKFFSVDNGHVTFIGSTGGGGLDENALANYLSTNKYLTETAGNSLYLGIKAKAASASTADSATNATNASNVYLNSASSNSIYSLVFANGASGANRALYVDSESSATAGYNPSTNTFVGNGFSGNSVTLGNGVYKPINSKGWYRFATTINAENVAGGSLIFSIRRQYNTSKTESHTIAVSVGYSAVTFTQIAGAPSDALITKVRATNNLDGIVYFDFYYSADTSNAHYVYVNCIGSATLQTPTATTQVLGYLTEFDLVNGFKSNVIHFTSLNNLAYMCQKCGKNLLVGGDNLSGGTAYAFAGYNYDSAVTVGRTYRLTICGKLGENTSHIYAYWDGGSGNNTYIGGLSKTEERIVTIRAKITNKGGNNRLIFYKFNSSNTQETTSYAYIRWAYLEEEFQESELTTSEYNTWLEDYNKRDTKTFLHKIQRLNVGESYWSADAGMRIDNENAYAFVMKRTKDNGGTFIRMFANNQTTKSWAQGADNSYAFSWWYQDGTSDVKKLSLDNTGSLTSDYWKLNNSSTNPYLMLTQGSTWYIQGYNGYLYLGAGSAKSMRVDSSGNVLTVGGITMYSDKRKKTILNHVELTLKQVADAPIIEHYYNSDEKKTTHVGSIAQYWAGLNDWFCKEDGDGFYTMEIQNAALASAISVARELMRYESKTDKQIRLLKKRICELEGEIETLKGK